jgi:hypothetical protein
MMATVAGSIVQRPGYCTTIALLTCHPLPGGPEREDDAHAGAPEGTPDHRASTQVVAQQEQRRGHRHHPERVRRDDGEQTAHRHAGPLIE